MSATPPESSLYEATGLRYLVQAHTGDLYGPEPMLTLVAWARAQRITADMLIAQENTDDWRRAESYPELSGVFHTPDALALQALESLSPGGVPPATGAAAQGGYCVPAYASPYGGPYVRPEGTNSTAIVSLVLSLVGLLICPILFSVLAIIFGCIAQSQIRQSRGREGGEGLAIAGIVLGVIGIPLGCLVGMMLSGARHF
jgi:hypothetical protein